MATWADGGIGAEGDRAVVRANSGVETAPRCLPTTMPRSELAEQTRGKGMDMAGMLAGVAVILTQLGVLRGR